MAKLHTKKKGKSGSRKVKSDAKWTTISAEEVEKVVTDLRKSGMEASKIGHLLRDQYAIASIQTVTGKTLTQIIEQNVGKIDYPEDILTLIKKAVNLRKHLGAHKSDVHNKAKLQSIESKIRRLGKYYARTDKLPETWTYNPATAALLVK